jgi:hypothetical protein
MIRATLAKEVASLSVSKRSLKSRRLDRSVESDRDNERG